MHGNHDAIAARSLLAPDLHRIKVGNTRILFLHGHQLDALTRGNATFSRFGVWLGGWLDRMGIRISAFFDALGSQGLDEAGPFERASVALADQLGADIVVTGHTHRAARLELGDHLFMNSGACVAGRREALLLDTATHSFDVVRDGVYYG